jgi:protein Tex
MHLNHLGIIAGKLNLPRKNVESVIALLNEGATIPFISRYRKEVTGSLDEVEIGDIQTNYNKLQEVEKRRETILKSIEEQGKMTDDLRKRITESYDLTELEDMYLPYKPKRRTRASIAREKGLEPLATQVFAQKNHQIDTLAQIFLNDQVPNTAEALAGARDIIAEWVSESTEARNKIRNIFQREALVHSKLIKGKEAAGAKFRDYFDFKELLSKCPSHRLLAMRRGEEEEILRVLIAPEEEEIVVEKLQNTFVIGRGAASEQVGEAAKDAYERLLAPSIETEFRNLSKEKADAEAIRVFTDNLRQLLLSAPLGQKRVLALDPGFRTGCKVVCLDANGTLLQHSVIYPHPPQSDTRAAQFQLVTLIEKYNIEAIAIGNGTAGRETVAFCGSIKFPRPIEVFMVSENGASIYSASDVARQEFPDQDVTVRGAISIGRRLMDPLAELVKIDPKSIGVGQYQHDVNQTALKESLDRVVESCVNAVGINLNTASKHLLTYISGVGPTLAQNIVTYRTENGAFKSRKELKKVARLGEKAFEQCAGFLRVRDAKNPLDNTAVHPESYDIVEKMASDLGISIENLIKTPTARKQIDLKKYVTEKVGLPTLTDILKELEKPGLDPRGSAKPFEFGNVHTLADLKAGMTLPGIVTNITNFGCFVDLGVKQDGLVHISQMSNTFIKNPLDIVKLHQEVTVRVVEVDVPRKRITLSMKDI